MSGKHPSALQKFTQQRTFECEECGNKAQAPKVRGRTNIGHEKHMYCYKCQKTTKHVQVE